MDKKGKEDLSARGLSSALTLSARRHKVPLPEPQPPQLMETGLNRLIAKTSLILRDLSF